MTSSCGWTCGTSFHLFGEPGYRVSSGRWGIPEPVADLLGGFCTNVVPKSVFRALLPETQRQMRALYEQTHLPQGASTSPALANLCGYRMDCRLAGLANAAGATYTRYADDLAFSGSGEFSRRCVAVRRACCSRGHRGGFHHQPSQNVGHAARGQTASCGVGREPAIECLAGADRPAKSNPDQLCEEWARGGEPGKEDRSGESIFGER